MPDEDMREAPHPGMLAAVKEIRASMSHTDWAIIEAYITYMTSLPGVIKTSSQLYYGDENFIVETAARKAKQQITHCKHGHPMMEGHINVMTRKGRDGKPVRTCRACTRVQNRKYRDKVGSEEVSRYQKAWRKRKVTPRTIFEQHEEQRRLDMDQIERERMAELQKKVD